jgi:glycosyltransferase involved in cell wall biosynthesis
MTNQNNFSVVIPFYNAEKTISETIESVLNQSYKADQIIAVDDGSFDGGAEIVKSYQAKHKEIEYFYQPNNGVSSARNLGINKARNENIFFLDADDLWLKNKIEIHNQHLLTHVDCKASFTNYISSDLSNGNLLHPNSYVNFLPINSTNLALNLVRINGSASSFLGKRDELMKMSGFDEKMNFGEDLDLWVRYAKESKVCVLSETCVVIGFNDPERKNKLNLNSISNLYMGIWGKIDLKLANHAQKFAARRILRIDIRRNARDLSYIFSKYPRNLQSYEKNFFNIIYRNYFGYLIFLAVDSFFDFARVFSINRKR